MGFDLKKTVSDAGKSMSTVGGDAGKAVGSAGQTAGKSVANAGQTAGKAVGGKVLGPIGDFFKKIWGWLKFVILVCCCCCILCICFFFGIPQMLFQAVGSSLSSDK